jgi:hypothetical protein
VAVAQLESLGHKEEYAISHLDSGCSSSLADYDGSVSSRHSMELFIHSAAFLAISHCVSGDSFQQLLGVDASPVCLVTDGQRSLAVAH